MRYLIILLLVPVFVNGTEQGDTAFVNRQNKNAQSLFSKNADSAYNIAMHALRMSEETGYEKGKAEAFNNLALVFREQEKFTEAESLFRKALGISRKINMHNLQASILARIGMMQEKHANYTVALENLVSAADLYEDIKDTPGFAKALNNIALVYAEQGNYDKAIEYYRRSIDLKMKSGDTILAGKSYNNIGIALISLKKYDEAIVEINRALEIHRHYAARDEQAYCFGNLGLAYDNKGDKLKAKKYYEYSISEMQALGIDDEHLSIPLNNLGTIYLEEKKFEEAEKYFRLSLDIAERIGSKEDMHEAYGNLAIVNAELKKFRDAYVFQQKFNALTDTLAKEKSNELISELMVKFDTQKKESENKLLKEQNQLQTLRLQGSNYLIYGLLLILLLISAISILLFRIRKLRMIQEKSRLEQKLLRSQMNPHFVFNAVNGIQSRILGNHPQDAYDYLTKFSRLIRLLLQNMHEDTIPLEQEIETIRLYIELEQLRFDEKFEFNLIVDDSLETENVNIPSMVVQPFLENAIWHGLMPLGSERKAALSLNFGKEKDFLVVTITDNGIGREKSALLHHPPDHQSLGIALTRQRLALAADAGGGILIEDVLDKNNQVAGTRVRIHLKINK